MELHPPSRLLPPQRTARPELHRRAGSIVIAVEMARCRRPPQRPTRWVATLAGSPPGHPPLQGDLEVDAAIVGAGIAASALPCFSCAASGRRWKRGGPAGHRALHREDHPQHGLIYQALEKSFGEEGAHAYGAANEAGLAQIVRFAEEFGIECDLERKPARL